MTTDTDKIENCPFCGNHAEFRHGAIHGESWGELRRVLWCSSSHCRAQMSLPYHYANADAVLIKSWNCRSLSVELTEWKIRCAELEQNAAHIQSSDEAEDLKRALTDCSVELTELRQAKESLDWLIEHKGTHLWNRYMLDNYPPYLKSRLKEKE